MLKVQITQEVEITPQQFRERTFKEYQPPLYGFLDIIEYKGDYQQIKPATVVGIEPRVGGWSYQVRSLGAHSVGSTNVLEKDVLRLIDKYEELQKTKKGE